jgi:hypothetical protein
MNIEEQLLSFFLNCTKDVFYKEIIYSSKFILSVVLPIFICLINYWIGVKYYRYLMQKDFSKFSRDIGIFFTVRIGAIIGVSFFLIKFELIHIKFFFITFFLYFFIFKILEVLKLNKYFTQ